MATTKLNRTTEVDGSATDGLQVRRLDEDEFAETGLVVSDPAATALISRRDGCARKPGRITPR